MVFLRNKLVDSLVQRFRGEGGGEVGDEEGDDGDGAGVFYLFGFLGGFAG
jgi:hypothetical protein